MLASGGLDSDVLLAEAAQRYARVWPVYIRQGLVWENAELFWLKRFLKAMRAPHPLPPPRGGRVQGGGVQPLSIFALPMSDVYGAHWSTGHKPAPGARTRDKAVYLPGRNMILSVKAAVFCSMNKIPLLAIAPLDHNPFPDASVSFLRTWGKALGRGLARPLRIVAPYRRLSKVDVIRRGKHLPLALSFSCIAPRGRVHCGRCNKCAERRRAFRMAKIEDKTRYAKSR